MTIVINDSRTHKLELVYTENLWTGRRTITFNGHQAEKKKRNLFVLHLENGDVELLIKGNNFTGITVQSPIFAKPIELRRKLSPFEYTFTILAIVLGIVGGFLGGWVGGVIGGVLQGCAYGALAGLGFALGLIAANCIKRKWLRYLVCVELAIVTAGLTFFLGYGVALLQLVLMG